MAEKTCNSNRNPDDGLDARSDVIGQSNCDDRSDPSDPASSQRLNGAKIRTQNDSAVSNSANPTKQDLRNKFDLDEPRQLLTGAQAILRLTLMQRARDKAAGHDTAGYVTGYRGSPIAGIEGTFKRFKSITDANNITFHSGLNEDLAATALWGAQQAELRGQGKYDGVFGIWYGKGPGVDRSGDVFRHANHAGTSKFGGILALMGDDHSCESSTSAHQSEFAFVDAMIPVLNPAGVQELLDFGILGFALSRYAGVWVSIKCVKDNIESTATVDGRLDRIKIKILHDFELPPGGLNIRREDSGLAKEKRLHDYKRDAITAFSRANKIDKVILSGGRHASIGLITTGKSYLDTRQALDELGLDEAGALALGLRLYKVGMPYPMEPHGFLEFAAGLDLIMVIEEKRSLIEIQVLEELNGKPNAPAIIGKRDEFGEWLFPAYGALDPIDIAIAIGERLIKAADVVADRQTAKATKNKAAINPKLATELARLKSRLTELKRIKANAPAETEIATRIPYYCAGCPHNSSTIVPEGAHAYAGIGCHYMVQWMDRNTDGFTQMGGEGANWIGEAPFSKRRHVFQNLGDGTYIHSGSLAIRAAVAAKVNITFKILYNDAVAMTGGQSLDGGISVAQIARQVLAEGITRAVIVTDEPAKYPASDHIPRDVSIHHRDDLMAVQIKLATEDGVTVLIYDQTCAAEKRRRRKRGTLPDPPKRVFINAAVCEGCGDCGMVSNCIAIAPLETELGRKRQIDQSACNKDFTCVNGFCPSFVTVHGASVKKGNDNGSDTGSATEQDNAGAVLPNNPAANLPHPELPDTQSPYTMLVTGIGGTGVVTISAILGQAAHLDGKGFGAIDMTGLAQKGGAVACHMRVADQPDGIHAIRAGLASADLIIGCDLMVTASHKVLHTIKPNQTAVMLNSHATVSAAFTQDRDSVVPSDALLGAINERAGTLPTNTIDAHMIALALFGDSIMTNMIMLGFAYQQGTIPIHASAIEAATKLNGVAVQRNIQAFRCGRLAAHDLTTLQQFMAPPETNAAQLPKSPPMTLADRIAYRAAYLTDYQNAALAQRYLDKIAIITKLERDKAAGRSGLVAAVALTYFKLLSPKDEYEVARLYTDGRFEQAIFEAFDGDLKLEFHLAPPLLARKDKLTGLPRKRRFGPWIMPVFKLLAKAKIVRGTRWDLFSYSADRRLEQTMLDDYEQILRQIEQHLTPRSHTVAIQLAAARQEVKGFGHIKLAALRQVQQREAKLLRDLNHQPPAITTPELEQAAE